MAGPMEGEPGPLRAVASPLRLSSSHCGLPWGPHVVTACSEVRKAWGGGAGSSGPKAELQKRTLGSWSLTPPMWAAVVAPVRSGRAPVPPHLLDQGGNQDEEKALLAPTPRAASAAI